VLDIDISFVDGENAVEIIMTHEDIEKLYDFSFELIKNGFWIIYKLFLVSKSIADILNTISNIDIEYNNIRINKMKSVYVLFIEFEPHNLKENTFIDTTEGVWLGIGIYCLTNEDFKLLDSLIEKNDIDVLHFDEIFSRKHEK
jgi:hypothetical protein